MYLHVGNGKNIRKQDVIGIFDLDSASVSPITRKYLSTEEKSGRVESATDDLPKSFIIYKSGSESRICLSQLATASLISRNEN